MKHQPLPADVAGSVTAGNLSGAATIPAAETLLRPSRFSNKVIPTVQRTTAGVEPYTGSWGFAQAAHLLRRTTFGAARQDIATLLQQTMDSSVNLLLAAPPPETSQPLNTDSRDVVPVGSTWVDAVYAPANSTFNPTTTRTYSLKSWWIGLMLNQQLSLREKMVLFWHNHFVTETAVVGDPRFSYRYLDLLRENALGNFKELTRLITVDGAMLRYLNGNTNTKVSPNENYARELQELFTIGKGPEVTPGDYTYYTEADVKAAARVLTGWRDVKNADGTVGSVTSAFDVTRHDTTDKQFSPDYGNTLIPGGTDGAAEIAALLDMIFAQQETALFICRKLYRWFVYYVIDDATEANVIAPMADVLRSGNYDMGPVLSLLFKSAHFYDPVNMGCVIKSPADFVAGMMRQFSVAVPSDTVPDQYAMYQYLWTQASSEGMNIGDPPNVAGWQAYYESPEYHELWINSDTLPKRARFAAAMIRYGYSAGGPKMIIDPIAFTRTLSNPADPNVVIEESAQYLFAMTLTDNQKAFLKNTLLPGLPDYEWTNEWSDYLADPTNAQKQSAILSKLQGLLGFMLSMPEYQLS